MAHLPLIGYLLSTDGVSLLSVAKSSKSDDFAQFRADAQQMMIDQSSTGGSTTFIKNTKPPFTFRNRLKELLKTVQIEARLVDDLTF